ncbi:ABC transporter permease [Hujiaoplasma nucleasis]|uniref:ABC transporter permease n=1 Tax=Hujiaoplasma nucleasis TaxID=2725268 RepID=A0A7L6N1J2_9MOLU|nr:ABC transporter permease [Hujiaoplasma nucleasis]QLY40130.1 ABC transporter permease [Hujiaoplasma nucleasis]
MLKHIIKAEIKNIFRDSMYLFFMLYPVILGVVGYFLIPYIEDQVSANSLVPEIISMIFILMTGFIFGAITAFTLLDDKDDNVLISLKITPISVKAYVAFKLLISFIFGFTASLVIILTTNFLPNASFWTILLISILGALQAPGVALIINSFATNKVEGFVIMKMSALILAFPVIAFFVQSWQEVFLVFAPGFWPARLIQIELLPTINVNFTFTIYFIIGVIYNLIFTLLFMKIYSKKSNL